MSIFESHNDPKDMQYISEVDAALQQRGHPLAFTLTLAIFIFIGVFFIWASFAMVDEVTRGQGQIIPAQGVHPIQSDRGGTVTELHVRENQHVDIDQVLVSLSNIDVTSTLQDLQNKKVELQLTLLRLLAEEKGTEPDFSQGGWDMDSEAVQSQLNLYTTSKLQFESEERQYTLQIEQRRSDATAARERRTTYERELALLMEKDAAIRGHVGTSYSEIDYLEHRQQVVAKQGELESVAQTIARNESAVRVAEERLHNIQSERLTKIAEELTQTRIELNTVEQQIRAGSVHVQRTELRSPVRGTVKRILIKQDSVAKPAETILEVIPTEGTLEVEARFSPADRGFLFVNQNAMVKVTAYDFSIYGGLEATVVKISQDTIEDKKGEPWYEVRLLTKRKSLLYRGDELEILPGMTVMVDVLTDQKSVLNHILAPLRRATVDAMTEH